jgi:short subunit dehydrogenase-like uncharacterized protein
MQVILGAGGAIGKDLARELKGYTEKVRLAGRNPQKVNNDDELLICDLTNTEMVEMRLKALRWPILWPGFHTRLKFGRNSGRW